MKNAFLEEFFNLLELVLGILIFVCSLVAIYKRSEKDSQVKLGSFLGKGLHEI